MTPEKIQYIVNKNPIGPDYINAGYKIVEFPYNDEGDNAYALVKVKSKKLISYSLSGQNERKHFSRLSKGLKKENLEAKLRKKVNSILESMLKEDDIESEGEDAMKLIKEVIAVCQSLNFNYNLIKDDMLKQDKNGNNIVEYIFEDYDKFEQLAKKMESERSSTRHLYSWYIKNSKGR